MQRFFVEPWQVTEKEVTILGTDYNHMAHVLRMKIGEAFIASIKNETSLETPLNEEGMDGASAGEYYCVIEEITDEKIIARIAYKQASKQELPCKITLFQGIPKGEKMELIIQKAVELGAAEIVPVAMKRSIAKIEPQKAKKKVERFQAIAESAAKQSGRGIIPKVTMPMSFSEAVNSLSQMDVAIIPYENATGMQGARKLIASITPGQSIGIMIGPEGGFDDEEIKTALDKGCKTMTLGKRILRTETAGLCILSVIMFSLSD